MKNGPRHIGTASERPHQCGRVSSTGLSRGRDQVWERRYRPSIRGAQPWQRLIQMGLRGFSYGRRRDCDEASGLAGLSDDALTQLGRDEAVRHSRRVAGTSHAPPCRCGRLALGHARARCAARSRIAPCHRPLRHIGTAREIVPVLSIAWR